MKKFIELTETINKPLYFNVDHIVVLETSAYTSGKKYTIVQTMAGYNSCFKVKETPQEILNLINS